jgi:hypothetical protein
LGTVFTKPLAWPVVKDGAQEEPHGGGVVAAFSAPEEPSGTILDLSSPSLVTEMTELDGRLHVLNGLLDASSRFYQVNETIQCSRDRSSALAALQQEPFGYTHQQAEALLEMPMGWQSAEELKHLREERDRLASRRASLSEHVSEVLAFHWFG